MILGSIGSEQERVRLAVRMRCNACSKTVRGGVTVAQDMFKTGEICRLLEDFAQEYLCGICRDAKRINDAQAKRQGSKKE